MSKPENNMLNTLSTPSQRIRKLIITLSKSLNVSIEALANIEKKLNDIILGSNKTSLNDYLERYTTLLEKEMGTLIAEKITPAFQFGIQNKYFTIIGYHGTFNGETNSKDIDEKTFFSFDSISKIVTAIITMLMIRDGKATLESTIHDINQEYAMDATIKSILNFTARIQTDKRIDGLSLEETIEILKKCRELLKHPNFWKYNDINFMLLRLGIPDFLERLDALLKVIDQNNLTYKNTENPELITGGKLTEENFTPDPKGRGIPFPGHTGLYGNIQGLLNLFTQATEGGILTNDELKILLEQPYQDPIVYNEDGTPVTNKNGTPLYIAKTAGFYRKPQNIIDPNYNTLSSCDFSNLTTHNARASAGTCGSWVMKDDLSYQGQFGQYVAGILTNPYSYINPGTYPETSNQIPNTNVVVNQKGIVLGHSGKLNQYKEIMTEYGILLELLTEYLKETDLNPETTQIQHITLRRKLKRPQ